MLFLAFLMTFAEGRSAYILPSELNLRLTDNSPFTVIVDNVHYPHPSNIFNINLLPGIHTVRVLTQSGIPIILFDGLVEMPCNSKTYAVVGYPNTFKVYHIGTYNYSNQSYPGNDIDISAGPDASGQLHFYNLKSDLRRCNTSAEKAKTARWYIAQHTINSGQLAEVLKMVDFEAHRIELAKFAYKFISDKDNFSLINEAFSFESSAAEVTRFAAEFGKNGE